jgi:FixJ family two-component response regulator
VTLVDVELGGESGFDLAEQLRQSGLSGPVIIVSTHSVLDLADMIAASSAAEFISKESLSGDAIRESLRGPADIDNHDHD